MDEDDDRSAPGRRPPGRRPAPRGGPRGRRRPSSPPSVERRLRRAGRLGPGGAEPGEDLAAGRPGERVAAEQLDAEGVQVVGDAGDEVAGGGRVEPLLVHQDVEHPAQERAAAGQGLVEHHPDAVPVARRREPQPGRLLGGHVRRGADHVPLGALVAAVGRRRGDQAEVHQDDAALRGSPSRSTA